MPLPDYPRVKEVITLLKTFNEENLENVAHAVFKGADGELYVFGKGSFLFSARDGIRTP
ncbi:MAG: hypothetical protein KKD69_03985 [Euryarchaeota archaeon]|nr:hypothetical protein [Euryarchaeota archaeon]MBU4491604.1 hypothetical protein [Euryarchaeota archaeon]MCG2728148.1 hypothetical protein [Candidatus Methanoperedenaceae archaeon]